MTNDYDHAEAARVFRATPEPPARLQCMSLPNGKFLLVLDRCPDGTADQAEDALRQAVPDGYAIASEYPIEVCDWPNDDLATAAAEACALTHGEEDAALISQVRSSFAGLHAEAEAWRMQGRVAVERVAELEAKLRELVDAGHACEVTRDLADLLDAA